MDNYITKEKIEKNLADTPLDKFSKKEFKIITDYYLENKTTSETEQLYKKVIKENAKNFFKELEEINGKISKKIEEETTEIYALISFLSLAPLKGKNILTESPILKTLRAIPTITDIFILYTEDSKKRFEELEECLKFKNIRIVSKSVDIENINESYNFLQEIVKTEGLDETNTILDSTLGLRMFGIALYKIAVERGLNLITWRDYQLPKYTKEGEFYKLEKNKTERIPFLTKLTLMQEPKFENDKIYRALIKELKNFNFIGASSYYNTLGLMDLKRICQDFDEVFGLKNILELNCDKFYFSLESTLSKILNYDLEEEKNYEIIKLILLKLLSIVNYKKLLTRTNNFNIKSDNVDSYIEELYKKDKHIKTKIYYSFVLKYLETKLGDTALDNLYTKNIIEKISKLYKKNIKVEDIEELIDILFNGNTKEHMLELETQIKLEDIFNIGDNLIDDVEIPIQINKNILKISKYRLNIDLLEEEKKRLKSEKLKNQNYIFTKKTNSNKKIEYNSIAIPLIKLLNNEIDELDINKLNEIYNVKESTFFRYKSELKHIISFINFIVSSQLKNKGEDEKNIFVIKNKKDFKIIINEDFKY